MEPEGTTVAILGLGLIGGSLARDLAARGVRVLGWDRDPATLRDAVGCDVVDRTIRDDFRDLADADCVVLALPVGTADEILAAARPHLGRARLITDVGSTKRSIAAAARRLGLGDRFVGAHPLAGDHLSGWGASRSGLFDGARVYLCPAPEASADALAAAERLWAAVGARTEHMDAAAHDRHLAWTSHLPQLAASALAGALLDGGVPAAELGPGGRDATRLAASAPDMWTAIALDNAAELRPAIAALRARLAALDQALADGDADRLHAFFETARAWRDAAG